MGRCTPEKMQRHLTRAQIEEPLQVGIQRAERAVRQNVTGPLTQAQFDALVSLTYNAGAGADGAQPMYREINRVGADAAAPALLTTAIHSRHIDARGRVTRPINRGVVNRRHLELSLYQGRS